MKTMILAAALSVPIAANAATETTVYTFQGGVDGATPQASLVMDAGGNLYGTTLAGGGSTACSGGCGTVFKLTPVALGAYTESVLYAFQGGADGAMPYAPLILDSSGNLYGVASRGGNQACQYGPSGCGTVFKITPSGAETTLHTFNGFDGFRPEGGLTWGSDGNLYGTAANGGGATVADPGKFTYGGGVMFQLVPPAGGQTAWTYNKEVVFSNGNDGFPAYSMIEINGNFYGPVYGETKSTCPTCQGMLYQISPQSNYFVRYIARFPTVDNQLPGGADPSGTLVSDANGTLYGTAADGGINGNGAVFAFYRDPDQRPIYPYTESVLHLFTGSEPIGPLGGVVFDSNGDMFGTGEYGGANGNGGVWQLTPGPQRLHRKHAVVVHWRR